MFILFDRKEVYIILIVLKKMQVATESIEPRTRNEQIMNTSGRPNR